MTDETKRKLFDHIVKNVADSLVAPSGADLQGEYEIVKVGNLQAEIRFKREGDRMARRFTLSLKEPW